MELFSGVAVEGIPLIFVVMGLVEWIKGFGNLAAWVIRVISLLIGLLFGSGFMIMSNGVPTEFASWFGIVVYGLGLGLVASGMYDAGVSATAKGG